MKRKRPKCAAADKSTPGHTPQVSLPTIQYFDLTTSSVHSHYREHRLRLRAVRGDGDHESLELVALLKVVELRRVPAIGAHLE